MSTCAVMQPHYLPWCGYFDLMDQVDAFVLYDDVEFSRQSWQQRNRIRGPAGLEWLSVPVLVKGRSHQRIDQVELRPASQFADTHLKTIYQCYRRAGFLEPLGERLAGVLAAAQEGGRLVGVTVPVIEFLRGELGIVTPLVRSSQLSVAASRSHRLVDLCRAVGAERYLSPAGAVGYLQEDQEVFADSGIAVDIQQYEHPVYPQQYEPFLSHASVVDLLLNVGPDALATVRSGRRAPLALTELAR